MRIACAIGTLVASASLAGPNKVKTRLNRFETEHYIIHTDLDAQSVREAWVRVDRMFEEYANRTRGFRGRINKKFPFYLYTRPEDYYEAGGLPGSSGVFLPDSDTLMAIVGDEAESRYWGVIQHEGFHQYVDAVIKGDIPTWMNEGLAEYFETALFTGQGYVSGVIPQQRLERVREQIAEVRFKSVAQMMLIKHEDWNEQMKGENYDQAWSMVHFLAHGEDGKYQERFIAFARDAGSGLQWEQAWVRHFGSRVDDFEKRWREYWTGLPDHPTREKYVEADVAVLTGFLGRAAAQKQRFDSVDEFFAAARAGTLKANPLDWLPPALLEGALERAAKRGTWSLAQQKKGGSPPLICTDEAGKTFTGRFTLRRDRVGEVIVEVAVPAAASTRPAPARGRSGKKP